MSQNSSLDGIARAQGAMGALQTSVGAIITAAAEAEARATEAERRVRELERRLDAGHREAYRRGYSTGYATARRGAADDPEAALRHPHSSLAVVA